MVWLFKQAVTLSKVMKKYTLYSSELKYIHVVISPKSEGTKEATCIPF